MRHERRGKTHIRNNNDTNEKTKHNNQNTRIMTMMLNTRINEKNHNKSQKHKK